MKPILVLVAALLATVAPSAYASCGPEESALRDIKLKQWPSYYRNQDVPGLDAFLHDGFRVIGGDGSSNSRSEELARVANDPWNPKDFSYTISSITCPNSTTAIIVGEGRFKSSKGDTWIEQRYVSSNVLIRVEGRWRAVISHISGEQTSPLAN